MNTSQPKTNLFAGLKDAKTTNKNPFLRPGRYEVRVKSAIYKVTRNKGDAFILEFTIEKSNYDEQLAIVMKGLNGQPYKLEELNKTLPNKAGETASWYQSLRDQDIGWGSLKNFAACITGFDPESEEFKANVEQMLNAVVQENQLQGALLPVEVVTVKTQKDTDFSRHNWGLAIDEPAGA
jgi:hypothetical protein